MTNSYLNISDKFDNLALVDLLRSVDAVAKASGIPFFVVGATARDIVLWYGYGIRTGRATRDIDLGFSVSTWEQFNELKQTLIATGNFRQVTEKTRMIFKGSTWVDLLPFGEIVDINAKIAWPPNGDTELNLLGFDEAFNTAITVRISDDPLVEVKIASAAGLVLLKIFAWDDRKPVDKDAIDLGILIRSYLQIGNQARFFDEHADLINDNFDYEVAGAYLLGRDLAAICQEETRKKILQILDRELDGEGDLPLVVKSAASSPQIEKTLAFWEAIRHELKVKQQAE